MIFRPCIDIHNGKVKQIVGSSLNDSLHSAKENFVSKQNADYYATLYKKDGLKGGHIIILNNRNSDEFVQSQKQALSALNAYPQGMQIGGGIDDTNAEIYINNGASHIIVTSFVFKNGQINYNNLDRLVGAVSKEKIVLDLSCRLKNNHYYIVTDRWQTYTDIILDKNTLCSLSSYCDEFLIHAVDVEGTGNGIDRNVLKILSEYKGLPITYAGGIKSLDDIETIKQYGNNRIDFTVGSALDIFGGKLSYSSLAKKYR